MVTGFIQGVRDEELIRRLHGPDGMPQTVEALMAAVKMYVKAEKSVALASSLEIKKEAWHLSDSRPISSIASQDTHPEDFTIPDILLSHPHYLSTCARIILQEEKPKCLNKEH
jgi:hypothetical protein